MKSVLVALVVFLTGCSAIQERRQQITDVKAAVNVAKYQECKQNNCNWTYIETLRSIEGEDLSAWQAYCAGE